MKKKPHHHHHLLPLPLFLVALLLTLTSVVDSQNADGGDAAVMQDLKKALTFPNKKLDWSDPNVCKWESIHCEQGRVTRIQIKDLGVTGTLPTNLNNLTALKDLELQGNHISGPLPTLTGMTALQNILINANNFSTVPSDFFSGLTSLQAVGMDKIPFQPWTIPQSLKNVSNLQNFSANSANIMGNIPDFFNANNFAGLINLHLAFNSLEGGLPRNFSGLSVASLWLNGQKLNGTIQVIQNMTNLKEIWLHSNAFTGALPDFSGLTDLEDLSLRDNQFTGPIPESLKKLASLKKVNLTNNMFQGPTPVFADSVTVDMDSKTNSFCFDDPGVDCDPRVNTLLSILKPLGYPTTFAQNWKGNDPCDSWVGILCARNNISVVDFANKNLTGTISPDFVNLTTLIRIDLSNNHLFGPIPKGLTSMPALRQLFLNDNQLSGDVPPDNGKELRLQGNPDLGGAEKFPSPPGGSADGSDGSSPGANPGKGGKNHGNGKKNLVRIIVGVIVAVVLVLLLLGVLGFCFYKRKKKFSRVQSPNAMVVHPRHSGSDPEMVKITVAGSNCNVGSGSEAQSHTSNGGNNIQMVETNNMVISIQVLRNVTNNFSEDNVLGRGGFGTVYKGELHDGTQIAVKRMESGVLSEKGKTEFESEIAVLTKVRHRHLVALVGYCLDGNERLLVYEYMPQGTLSHHLFNWRDVGMKPLEWTRRVSIALDVARAVEYLHSLANQSFIHRDLKPSNILLGDDMRAKVADFGLVRLAPEGKGSIETRLAGTFGYLAPEYAVTGRVTTKVDVYSFGVILMELITGRKALQETEPEESMHLVTWFRRMHINKDTFHKAIDPNINLTEETLASVTIVAELAGHCCAREPYQRPGMGHAVNVLSSLVELWKPSDPDSEDIYGIDLDMTLPQALKKWQAFEGSSRMEGDTSSFLASVDNTQTSIPDRPSGFSSTFNSGR